MIRFCDKEVLVVAEEELAQISRRNLLRFFWENGTMQVIVVMAGKNTVMGTITYPYVLKYQEKDKYILNKIFVIHENFWEEAKEFFEKEPQALVPVCVGGRIVGFAYEDTRNYKSYEYALKTMETRIRDWVFIQETYPQVKQVCIMDCNEYAYRIYQLCRKRELPVCVIGEKWEWFGISSYEGFLEYPEYEKFYIYAEGTANVREEKEYQGYAYVGRAFHFLREIETKNVMKAKRELSDELKRKGTTICEVVIPSDEKVLEKTKTEYESDRYNAFLDKYIEDYDDLSVHMREIIEKIHGKELCKYF